MKNPIFTEDERRYMIYPELEIAKLKFRRDLQKGRMGQFMVKIVEWLSRLLS